MRQQHLALLLAISAASRAAPVSNRNARLLSIARELIDVVADAQDEPEPSRVIEGNTLGCWNASTKKWFRCWTDDRIVSPKDQEIDDLWHPFPGVHHDTDLEFGDYDKIDDADLEPLDVDDDYIDDFDDFQHPFPGLRHELTDLEPFPFDDDVTKLMYLDGIDRLTLNKGEDTHQDYQDAEPLSDDDDYYYHPGWESIPDDDVVWRVS